jgi:betaine-aldehyde dehydrogenase
MTVQSLYEWYGHMIGNELVRGDGPTGTVISPASGQRQGIYQQATALDVDRAVVTARATFDQGDWAFRTSVGQRAKHLTAIADLLEAEESTMLQVIVNEMGSPITWARAKQVAHPLSILRWYANVGARELQLTRGGEIGPNDETVLHVREPVGVVGVITPWNMPLKTIVMKVAPALLTGCTVVVKPAPETALSALYFADICRRAGLPDGVLSVIPGERHTGVLLVAHPLVDKIAFTGSTAAGKKVAAEAAGTVKRVTLELGGKSAALVCEDVFTTGVDLEALADKLVAEGMANSGQICSNHTRVLVPNAHRARLVDALAARVRALRIGAPWAEDTEIGPLVRQSQQQMYQDHIRLAVDQGATLAAETELPVECRARGWYVQPAVFTDVDPERHTLAHQEVFGPVLAVIGYDTIDEAISIANGTRYGLEAAVYSTLRGRAIDIADALQAGTVRINGADPGINAPLGGYKQSGIGRELGMAGLEHYLEHKTMAVNYGAFSGLPMLGAPTG